MKPEELMMSDVPWAVAWYGRRQCVWLTLNSKSAFLCPQRLSETGQRHLFHRLSMDDKFLSQMARGDDNGWGRFIFDSVMLKKIPTGFPLQSLKEYGDRHVSDRPTALVKLTKSGRRPAQPVGNTRPFRQFRRHLDKNQLCFSATLVTKFVVEYSCNGFHLDA